MFEKLNNLGLKPLSKEEENQVSDQYRNEFLAALSGRPKSIRCYPALFEPIKLSSLKEDYEVLVIEIGGTNIYGARVRVEDNIVIISHSQTKPFISTSYQNVDDFFKQVAESVRTVFNENKAAAIGIVYSFPGSAVKTKNGIDIISPEKLPKGFAIPGISKRGIGEAFLEILERDYGIEKNLPFVVINDTVAVLFSKGAKIGGVVGTGFNIAATSSSGIINTESGAFDIPAKHDLIEKLDENSSNPGLQLTEKQVGGLYLGEQLKMIMDELGIQGEEVSAKNISELLEEELKDDNPLLKEAAKRLRDRSAQIVGVIIGTIINTFPEIYNEEVIEVPIEGSLFWNIPLYEEKARIHAEKFAKKKVKYVNIENAGRIGAAIAALSFVK